MNGKTQNKFTEEQIRAAEEQIVDLSKRIDFYITEYTVEILALKMERKEFEVPDYQREFTWEPERRSRFIESLLMGLPIPFLFFWQIPISGKLEIVDGSQRLRTVKEFLLGDLALGNLEELTHLTGFQFKDLPEARQLKVKNLSIRGVLLSEHVDEHARLELFDRINTGSQIAQPAEVRRGALKGEYQKLVVSLAENPEFAKIAPVTKKKKDTREREELVTRFFAYGDGLEDYHDRPAQFIFDYTKKINALFKKDPGKARSYSERFIAMIEFVARNFPWGFRRVPKSFRMNRKIRTEVMRPFRNDQTALAYIKTLRNDLAHGSMSFAECGRGVTVGDLRHLKKLTAMYLREVISCFKTAIGGYEFLVPEQRPQGAKT